jgi:hypothetical protein
MGILPSSANIVLLPSILAEVLSHYFVAALSARRPLVHSFQHCSFVVNHQQLDLMALLQKPYSCLCSRQIPSHFGFSCNDRLLYPCNTRQRLDQTAYYTQLVVVSGFVERADALNGYSPTMLLNHVEQSLFQKISPTILKQLLPLVSLLVHSFEQYSLVVVR